MKQEIEKAAEIIRQGGVILYPTDTIWGLGCDPTNDEAVKKIIAIKHRADSKSFIVLVNSEQLLNRYTTEIPDICYDLIDMATDPLTVIYPKGKNVSSNILADDGSIAIRKTDHAFCSGLMNNVKCGLVSTSANISGNPFPAKFDEIDPVIRNSVDYVVTILRDQPASKPSRIVKIGANSEVKIIR